MKGKAITAVLFGLLFTVAVADISHARDLRTRFGYGADHYPGKCPRGPAAYSRRVPGPGYFIPGYEYGYYGGWWYCPDRSAFGSSLSRGEATKLVQWLIRWDPNLEVGDVLKVEDGYEVTIVTRKGKRLVDTLFVDKVTAFVYPIYKSVEE